MHRSSGTNLHRDDPFCERFDLLNVKFLTPLLVSDVTFLKRVHSICESAIEYKHARGSDERSVDSIGSRRRCADEVQHGSETTTCFFASCVLVIVMQVLTNVAVALAAMGVGALGLPLDLSNLLGGAMVLLFVLFGRFLLNGDRITSGTCMACATPAHFWEIACIHVSVSRPQY